MTRAYGVVLAESKTRAGGMVPTFWLTRVTLVVLARNLTRAWDMVPARREARA